MANTMTTTEKSLILTAYNEDVQRYFQGGYCNTKKANAIISAIEEKVLSMRKSFSKLFPKKQKIVLNEIIYLLSGKGICKIGADKLAEKANCSVRTVKSAVSSLKATDEILVARLADDNAGKYIFVYKKHENFKEILKQVFFIDELPEETTIAPLVAPQFAPLQNDEVVGAVSVDGEKASSNYNNSFKSFNLLKQEKDIIRDSIENEVKISKDYQKYFVSNMQNKLYHQILSSPFPKEIIDNAGLLALRAGDIDEKGCLKAYKAVFKISTYINEGMDVKHLLAVFTCELKTVKKPSDCNKTEETPREKVPFYDWLTIRD